MRSFFIIALFALCIPFLGCKPKEEKPVAESGEKEATESVKKEEVAPKAPKTEVK